MLASWHFPPARAYVASVDDPFRGLDAAFTDTTPPAELHYAHWVRRILGAVIDVCAMSVIAAPFTLTRVGRAIEGTASPADVRFVTIVSLLTQIAYMTALHGWRGSTLGKMAMRTAVRRMDGSPIDFNLAFVRAVTLAAINFVANFLLLIPLIANAVRPLWHPKHQTWHDQVARTVVLSISPREQPESVAAS